MRLPSSRRREAPGPAREPAPAETDEVRPEPPELGTFLRYFLRLGTLGFGGPIAVVGYMQRDLVEQRGWISKQDFLDGVALGQTMPGPLAAQVAMWVGYLKRGSVGAAATALAFIAPSFLMVFTVAAVYAHYSGLAIVQSLFYGIAPPSWRSSPSPPANSSASPTAKTGGPGRSARPCSPSPPPPVANPSTSSSPSAC
jgi:chromate transporter